MNRECFKMHQMRGAHEPQNGNMRFILCEIIKIAYYNSFTNPLISHY